MTGDVSLDDRYALTSGRVLLSGTQALVRLLIEQARADEAAGRRTAGFVSGYRGSPLGGFDQELWRAERHLSPLGVRFQPGINEDLAATAVWGSQQANAFPGARHQGVFGMWYGKGPGVDRSGDALKHANAWGTSPLGGVVAIAGDDHGAKSSSLAHQSEFALIDARMPVLHPSNPAEIVDFGLYGYALSRFAGLWVGMKLAATTVDSAMTTDRHGTPSAFVLPGNEALADERCHIRWPDGPLAQEQRMIEVKLPAARAFIAANPLDHVVWATPRPQFAILAVGKASSDARAALDMLGVDEGRAGALGLRLIKLGIVWPIDVERIVTLLGGADTVLVVEEKRALIEAALKEAFYDRVGSHSPRIIGKAGRHGAPLLSEAGELDAVGVARAIAHLLGPDVELQSLPEPSSATSPAAPVVRTPYFCSGCPHNSSTRLPEGSVALGGIGCHSMAMHMDRGTVAYTQMGGEGATWIGQAPFTETPHVFQNLGDGTFFHSGSLGVRAAVAARVNITFKILYNDAVAMTGGQPVDGALDVPKIVKMLRAEGVSRIAIVAADPSKHARAWGLGGAVTLHHRDRLDLVQRELRGLKGVSALIFDQVCAAELRRRRKRGTSAKPAQRVFINPDVCEGCGDCGIQSNCLSIQPLETRFGTKRQIDQASCNIDMSCLKGFCPSFVTVEGERRAQSPPVSDRNSPPLPEPEALPLDSTYRILIAGVGGTGVVTIGALLAMAAHIEGKAAATYDMTGMAQKGGPVLSHVAIAPADAAIAGAPAPAGSARLLIGCDPVVAADAATIARLDAKRGAAVWNSRATAIGAFTRDPDLQMPLSWFRETIRDAAAAGRSWELPATGLAEERLGDAVGANLLLLGHAWQRGLVPLALRSIEAAIRLNGVQAEMNLAAFSLGRSLALEPADDRSDVREPTLDDVIDRYADFLEGYQNAAYSQRYRSAVAAVRAAEALAVPGASTLADAAARSLGKLMAYKDEYEVARLHSATGFADSLRAQFEPGARLVYHLAPPFLGGKDPAHPERPRKRAFGAWIAPLLRIVARMRGLRGTWFDPFGHGADRRMERALIADYLALLERLARVLTPTNHAQAVALARLPERIRGFGPVKAASIAAVNTEQARLMAALEAPVQKVNEVA